MRQSRLSGSVEGVMGNHDSYSDSEIVPTQHNGRRGHDTPRVFDLRPHTYLVSAVSFSPRIFSIEKTLMNVPESVLTAVCLADPSTTRSKWKRVPSPRSIWSVPVQSPLTM